MIPEINALLQTQTLPERSSFKLYKMDNGIPSTSYSTIFHCDQSLFICTLRLLEGLVSMGMLWMFWRGYRAISRQRNNKVSSEERWLYLLALFQTLLLALYYLLFEEFFMLATIRNLLLWISLNVLHIFCILNWEDKDTQRKAQWGIYILQTGNFLLWFVISLGDGSSLENTDFNLGYNCMINDWMILSGSLLGVNLCIAALGFFKIDKLDFENRILDPTDTRRQGLIAQERTNIILMVCSGLAGAMIMFAWDFLAYNNSVDRTSCQHLFSGDSIFRNILCFILKIISMQLNPAVIYYNVYFCRREEFQRNTEEPLLAGEEGFDPFARGPSVCNLTVSSRRSQSFAGMEGRDENSTYQ